MQQVRISILYLCIYLFSGCSIDFDFEEGTKAEKKGNYSKAFFFYTKAASNGNILAQNNLGNLYFQGLGTKQDYKKALKCYIAASKGKNKNAVCSLGYMCKYGLGTKKDFKKAFILFQKANQLNSTLAPFYLAEMYEKGEGVKQNYPKAYSYYKKASTLGHKKYAFYKLGCFCRDGKGIEKNISNAIDYFIQSADYDCTPAQNALAYLYAEENIKLEDAIVLINKALRKKPDNGAYLDTLGWILYKQGKYNKSVIQLEKADKIKQNRPVILDHLGDVYQALGKTKKAEEQWQKAFVLTEDEKLKKRIEKKLNDAAAVQ